MKQSGTNVQVAVRCRPLNNEERKAGVTPAVVCELETKSVNVAYGNSAYLRKRNLVFDHVFGPYSRQDEVFETLVKPIVDEALAGFNCTIFAYGQTGTGKTHTMEGVFSNPEEAGIVPRSVKTIFEQLERSGAEFTIRVSYLELYNEELLDLFDPFSNKKLQLCEDAKKGVICQNLDEIPVLNVEHIFDILQKGVKQRQSAATLMNKNSSRSHSIFTMKIMIKEVGIDGEEFVRHGQLNLVDLAGSECVARSGAKEDRAREAGSINQSLLTLGRVINSLVEHHSHIPYRDSKLTRLLQESLGGKAKTVIIATLSPSAMAIDETISTLEYAFRAKTIKNQPMQNQKQSKNVLMKEFMAELESLRAQLHNTREKVGVYLKPSEYAEMEAKIRAHESQLGECECVLKLRTEELKVVKSERDDLTIKYDRTNLMLERALAEVQELTAKLDLQNKRLKDTAIELNANEAVVIEQSHTENQLLNEGHLLEKNLQTRNIEVNRLLQKVDTLSKNDQFKSNKCELFVADMREHNHDLLVQIENITKHNKENVASLHEEVNSSTVTGKLSCENLQNAVKSSLRKISKCAEKNHAAISTENSNAIKHFEDLQSKVNGSLDVLEKQILNPLFQMLQDGINRNEEIEANHVIQLESLSAILHEHFGNMAEKSNEFLKQQEHMKNSIQTITSSLKGDIMKRLEIQNAHTTGFVESAKSALSAKAEALEKSMLAMIRDLVVENHKLLDDGTSESACISAETAKRVVAKSEEISTVSAAGHTVSLQRHELERGLMETHLQNNDKHMQKLHANRSDSKKEFTVIRDASDKIRIGVNESANRIVSDIKCEVQLGTTTAHKSTKAVDDLLHVIVEEATELDSFVVANTSTLSTSLSESGKTINDHITSHISGIDSHLQQQTAIVEVQNQSLETLHSATTALCAVYAADEPLISAPFNPPQDHKTTRPHATIMHEVRTRLQPETLETVLTATAGCIPDTSNVLQPLMSPASFSVSRSTSSDGGGASGRKERCVDLTIKKRIKTLRQQPPLGKSASSSTGLNNKGSGFVDKNASRSFDDHHQNDANSSSVCGEFDENAPNEVGVSGVSSPITI